MEDTEEGSDSTAGITTLPVESMAEPNIDGLSLSLRYQLQDTANETSISETNLNVYDFWGATHRDGTRGEDFSRAIKSAWMKNSNKSSISGEDVSFSIHK